MIEDMIQHVGFATTMGWTWFIVDYVEDWYNRYKMRKFFREMLLKNV